VTHRRKRRVVESHALVTAALRAGGGFALVAIVWAAAVLIGGGSWWGPLHAFLAGTVLLAISGFTLMFTVTWAAAPAPSRLSTALQRRALVVGVASVLAGVGGRLTPLVWGGGTLVLLALALLARSLVGTVRRSLLRRFDMSARFYLLALGCGTLGVTAGILLGTGSLPEMAAELRLVHSHLNLVGLLGFTIAGTLPTLLTTFAHHRAVSGTELRVAWWASLVAAATITSGVIASTRLVGVGTLLAGAALVAITAGVVLRLGERGWRAGLPYLQVLAGVGWLVAWALVDGLILLSGSIPGGFAPWAAAAVVAGIGQVLAGSLSYLLAVVAGPPIGANLQRLTSFPAIPLTLANLTGIALLVRPSLAPVFAGLWALDLARRLLGLRRSRESGSDAAAG
jgi:nitrite reductase (NO-forming)